MNLKWKKILYFKVINLNVCLFILKKKIFKCFRCRMWSYKFVLMFICYFVVKMLNLKKNMDNEEIK